MRHLCRNTSKKSRFASNIKIYIFESKAKIRELSFRSQQQTPRTMAKFRPRTRRKDALVMLRRTRKCEVYPLALFMVICGAWRRAAKLRKMMICRVCHVSVNRSRATFVRLIVLRPMQKPFAKAVHFRTYRLKNEFQRWNLKITLRGTKMARKLGSQLKKTDLDGMDSISILTFWEDFREICDNISIQKEVATWLVLFL